MRPIGICNPARFCGFDAPLVTKRPFLSRRFTTGVIIGGSSSIAAISTVIMHRKKRETFFVARVELKKKPFHLLELYISFFFTRTRLGGWKEKKFFRRWVNATIQT